MTLSMKIALDLINEKKDSITYEDLGYILTVLRDNAVNDDVYKVLERFLEDY